MGWDWIKLTQSIQIPVNSNVNVTADVKATVNSRLLVYFVYEDDTNPQYEIGFPNGVNTISITNVAEKNIKELQFMFTIKADGTLFIDNLNVNIRKR